MALRAEDLDRMEALTAAVASAREAVAALRSGFPGMTISRVDAMDMRDEVPARKLASFDLFLVDARNHCWTVTQEPQLATGVVVADHA